MTGVLKSPDISGKINGRGSSKTIGNVEGWITLPVYLCKTSSELRSSLNPGLILLPKL